MRIKTLIILTFFFLFLASSGFGESISLTRNFTWSSNLVSVYQSSIVAGDIDNDGRLDLIMTGNNGTSGIAKVYTNSGTTLTENSTWGQNLTNVDVYSGSVSLGDIDNDGRLDLIVIGASTAEKNGVYINNGTTFMKNSSWLTQLPKVGQDVGMGAIILGDIDNNGYLDIVMAGGFSLGLYFKAYTNNGTTLTENSTWINWTHDSGFNWPSLILGDVNNDGRLDLDFIGTGGWGDRQRFFINNGTTFVLNQTAGQGLYNYFDGSIAFGDYNNDGTLDLASNGKEAGSRSTVYRNNITSSYPFAEDTIAESDFKSDDMQQSSIIWVDIDNDNDLDLISTGKQGDTSTHLAKVYLNNVSYTNTPPSSPTQFWGSYSNDKLNLTWGKGSDTDTTADGLYYNLKVGTCSGCHDIISGIYGGSSNPTAGYFGNMMQRKSITINRNFPNGTTIYWSVQTIDTGLAKSSWSAEQSYRIGPVSTTTSSTTTTLNATTTTSNATTTTGATTTKAPTNGGAASGSGGGGISSPTTTQQKEKPIEEPVKATIEIPKITANETSYVKIETRGVSISQIAIIANSTLNNVQINITKETKPSVNITFTEKVYQYLRLEEANIADTDISSVKINFTVEKSWINRNNINSSTVKLLRFKENWTALPTNKLSETSLEIIYEADSPGLSVFAIAGEEYAVDRNAILALVIGFLIVLGYLVFSKRKKKRRKG